MDMANGCNGFFDFVFVFGGTHSEFAAQANVGATQGLLRSRLTKHRVCAPVAVFRRLRQAPTRIFLSPEMSPSRHQCVV